MKICNKIYLIELFKDIIILYKKVSYIVGCYFIQTSTSLNLSEIGIVECLWEQYPFLYFLFKKNC